VDRGNADAKRIIALDEPEFASELRAASATISAGCGPSARATPIPEPAYRLELRGPRLALIGDAAHVVHPIAGLGLNLGFRDIAALAETTADTIRLGLDHGGPAALERYQAWRRLDTVLVAAMTDGLNRLFSSDSTACAWCATSGWGWSTEWSRSRASFVQEAAGLHRQLPKLLTGEPV
jgi:2-octaprenyl-6-methoxyphenol hydroxylase